MEKIRSAGMKTGIWVHRVHRPSDPGVADIGKEHPDWFVRKSDGELFMDHGFYLLNTHNKHALEAMARRTYRALKKQGWDYVKIDGAGDLLNAYRRNPEYFKEINATPGETLRKWDLAAREELGPDVYILTCWGVQPGMNVVGLVDGCRLGSDGFGPAGFQRFNSWDGVVWRNDPDHCDILAEWLEHKTTMKTFAVKEAMTDTIVQPSIVSMAGGVLMVSDKVEAYKDDSNLEGMKRSTWPTPPWAINTRPPYTLPNPRMVPCCCPAWRSVNRNRCSARELRVCRTMSSNVTSPRPWKPSASRPRLACCA